jgi:hypothetical protein
MQLLTLTKKFAFKIIITNEGWTPLLYGRQKQLFFSITRGNWSVSWGFTKFYSF